MPSAFTSIKLGFYSFEKTGTASKSLQCNYLSKEQDWNSMSCYVYINIPLEGFPRP